MSIPLSPIVSEFETEEQAARMVVHPNYLVICRVIEQVEILAVLHTRQEYPSDAIGLH